MHQLHYPFTAAASTPRRGHQKEDPMNPEPAHVATPYQQQTQPDLPHVYGKPASTYLPLPVIVRLTIFRSKLQTVRYERDRRLYLMSQCAG